MGGDHGPGEIVAGAVEAAKAHKVTISLVGPPDVIEAELAKHDCSRLNLPIVPATQVIDMADKPANAVRAKPDSSIVVASRMVRSGEAQAFVTAGNTGAALAAGIFQIGRIKGIMRPALATPFPTVKGFCVVLDVGANVDMRPEHMQQFAIMGNIYAQTLFNLARPVVRILSNGEEEGKGNQLVISSYNLLANTPSINFQGNIESKEVFEGGADVIVTDGFTGNVFIKTAEATAKMLQNIMLQELTAGPISSVGAFLAQAALRRMRKRTDDSQFGGAVLLGLSGLVVVAHGRSRVPALVNAVRVAKQSISQNLSGKIEAGINESAQDGVKQLDDKAVPSVAG